MTINSQTAIQDQIHDNNCYGCGADNHDGLRIKSYWRDEKTTECYFTPQAHHCAGPLRYLNGGIIATIIDCHAICTALANAYKNEGREVGQGENIWYVTGKMDLQYQRPTEIKEKVLLTASLIEVTAKKAVLKVQLISQGEVCVTADVVAIRVPSDWA